MRVISIRLSNLMVNALGDGHIITLGGYLTASANASAMIDVNKTADLLIFKLRYMMSDSIDITAQSTLYCAVRG